MKLRNYLSEKKLTQQQFAEMLGIKSQGAISSWFKKNRIPAERVLQIEEATNGELTRHDLRPDLYPLEEAG